MFERVAFPILMIDSHLTIVGCNQAGADLLQAGHFVARREEHLSCADPASQARLVETLVALAQGASDQQVMIDEPMVSVRRQHSLARQMRVTVEPLLDLALPNADGGVYVLLFRPVPQASLDLVGNTIRLFGLTAAQARIASQLATGRTIKQIAFYSRISVNTVRHHVKAIFAKTGTNRQVDLVQLLNRVAESGQPDRPLPGSDNGPMGGGGNQHDIGSTDDLDDEPGQRMALPSSREQGNAPIRASAANAPPWSLA